MGKFCYYKDYILFSFDSLFAFFFWSEYLGDILTNNYDSYNGVNYIAEF